MGLVFFAERPRCGSIGGLLGRSSWGRLGLGLGGGEVCGGDLLRDR